MSNATGGNGVTAPQSPTGIQVIQASDFYQRAGILHPITVGTIAILLLFLYLRVSSNRCVAPVTLFDWILNVALGSTLAGIVNGTSLVRGIISLITLCLFQLASSQISSHCGKWFENLINSRPLVIAFRGEALDKVMRTHRISHSDLNYALRKANVWHISQIEAVILEATGDFSIYKQCDRPDGVDAEVLMDVPGYRKLVEHFDDKHKHEDDGKKKNGGKAKKDEELGHRNKDSANEIAGDAA